ncbi:AGE family epimerase/isomerase [uncultured Maricaulis sp.]|uniref:AGE family epimerase/isomerase n=1 Tax=uncultured Maricaulis sp. TaxID=174710 RepID=UPI002639EE73|nr:AGE family epimerase/isomerase [uncultured Maricaulis sp.]
MSCVARFVDWGLTRALPFWEERAWDRRSGGFLESLSFDGLPISGDIRRVRTQARQIFVFARAHLEGWCDGRDLALEGYGLLERRAHAPDGKPGWVHRLTDSGEVADPLRDLYDHAFILLAQAWMYRLTGDQYFRTAATDVLGFLDERFAESSGGYRENIGGVALPRRQNPHMHLFESLLAWHQVTGDPAYLKRADNIAELLLRAFLNQSEGWLGEFFDDELAPLDGRVGKLVEPGHEFEWVWLLADYCKAGGDIPAGVSEVLYDHAMRHGRNSDRGFAQKVISASGKPVEAGSRTWVQTEWLRATLARQRAGYAGAIEESEEAARQLLKWHLDPAIPGGWIDHFDADGLRVADRMPASTLYHLLGAVEDAHRIIGDVGKTTGNAL